MNSRYELTAFQFDPNVASRRGNVTEKRFDTMAEALGYAVRFRATPPQTQYFQVEIRDKTKSPGDAELIWQMVEDWPSG
jgi:hypothetical protein